MMKEDLHLFAIHTALIQRHYNDSANKVAAKVAPKNAKKVKIRLDHRTEILVDAKKLKRKGIDYFKKLYNK